MIEALQQRYEVLAELGEGGFGRVFAVRDRESGARLAVKTISRPDPLRLSLLKREARVVGDIVHPNLLTLHGLEQAGDLVFLTMDLINGVRLDSYVAYGRSLFTETKDFAADTAEVPQQLLSLSMAAAVRESAPVAARNPEHAAAGDLGTPAEAGAVAKGTPLPWRFSTLVVDLDAPADGPGPRPARRTKSAAEQSRLRESAAQLARAIAALHSTGRVHSDIKPDNVLVERDGRVVLLDFGLAFAVDEERLDGRTVGTPGFMAPEQLRGERCTPATDWYAFGAVLHLLLYDEPPYALDGASLGRIAFGGVPDRPPPLEEGLDDLADLAARLLLPEPGDRPDDSEVMATLQVEAAADGQEGLATTRRVATLREWASATGPLLVGRDDDLLVLSGAMDKVLGGSSAMVTVHGPSGVGTTMLLDTFCRGLKGPLLLHGRCYEHESVPFAGWDSLVDGLAETMAQMPPAAVRGFPTTGAAALLRLFPVLGKVAAFAELREQESEQRDPAELRDAAFDALFAILAGLATVRPVVVRLDDLHWVDRGSAAMALRLFETLPERPLLVVLSWHDADETAPDLLRLSETDRCVDLVLAPLTPEDSRELSLHLLPPRCPDRADLAGKIAAQSGGLPLFIAELALAASQELDASGDLESLIRRRTGALPPEARRLLQVVAMAGRPVALRTTADLAQCRSPDLAARVLVAENLVRSSGRKGRVTLECLNARVVSALRSDQEAGAVREVLLGLADRTSADEDPEAKGRLLLAAGEERRAAPLLLAAAEHALAALAFERAEEILALAEPGLADHADRLRCAWARGEALQAIGMGKAAAQQFLAAADAGDPEQLCECQRRATEQLVRSGDFGAARNLLGQVLSRAGMGMPGGSIRTILGLLLQRVLLRLGGLRFRPTPEPEVDAGLLRRIDTASFVSQGLALFAPVPAASLQIRNLRLAIRAAEPARVARELAVEAGLRAALGGRNLEEAEDLLSRSVATLGDIDNPRVRAVQILARSILAFQAGLWQPCQEQAERAADLIRTRCRGAGWELGTALIYQTTTLSLRGEHSRLARLLPKAIRRAADRGDAHTELHLRLSQPIPLACVQGRPDDGRREVLAAWGRWGGLEWGLLDLYALRQLIELALYERDWAGAKARSDELWSALSASHTRHVRITTLFAHASRLKVGLLGLADGVRTSERRIRRDIAALERSGMAWARAEALAARAQRSLLASDDAAAQFREAAALYVRAGQRAHAEACSIAATGRPSEAADSLSVEWLRGQGAAEPARLIRMLLPAIR